MKATLLNHHRMVAKHRAYKDLFLSINKVILIFYPYTVSVEAKTVGVASLYNSRCNCLILDALPPVEQIHCHLGVTDDPST